MRKEFKIGMFLGLALVIVGIIYLSLRKDVSTEERTLEQTQHLAADIPMTEVNAPADTNASIAAILDTNTAPVAPSQPVASTSQDLTQFEQAQPIKAQRFHIVQRGDMLSTISQKYYGTVKKVDKIVEANRNILKDKNTILKPGMKLVIPD